MIDWDSFVLGPIMGAFGEQIIYKPRGGIPVIILDAVLDEESVDIQLGEDAQVSTQRKPIIGIRAMTLPTTPAQNDRITVPRTGITYVVKDVEPDGHGHIKLSLMQAAS